MESVANMFDIALEAALCCLVESEFFDKSDFDAVHSDTVTDVVQKAIDDLYAPKVENDLEPFKGIKIKTEYMQCPAELDHLRPENSLPSPDNTCADNALEVNIAQFKTKFEIALREIQNDKQSLLYATFDLIDKHLWSIGNPISLATKARLASAIAVAHSLQNKPTPDSKPIAILTINVINPDDLVLSANNDPGAAAFYLHQAIHILAHRICKMSDIPPISIVSETAAEIDIILPNIDHKEIENEVFQFNKWLHDITQTSTNIAWSILPLELNDLQNQQLLAERSKGITHSRFRAGLGIIHDGKKFIEPQKQKPPEMLCEICGKTLAKDEHCHFCEQCEKISSQLGKVSWIVESPKDILEFKSYEGSWSFANLQDLIEGSNDDLHIETINDYSYRYFDIANVQSRWLLNVSGGSDSELYGSLYAQIDDFHVDNYSSYLDVSRMLQRFLTLNLSRLHNRKFSSSIDIVNADGLFAFGDWKMLLDFTRDMLNEFDAFCGEKIKLRCGFAVCDGKMTQKQAYNTARRQYDKSVRHDVVFSGLGLLEDKKGFTQALDQASMISVWFMRGLLDKQTLLELHSAACDAKALLQDSAQPLELHLFPSKIARCFGSLIGKADRDIIRWFKKLLFNPHNEKLNDYRLRISKMVFPLRYSLYSNDKEA